MNSAPQQLPPSTSAQDSTSHTRLLPSSTSASTSNTIISSAGASHSLPAPSSSAAASSYATTLFFPSASSSSPCSRSAVTTSSQLREKKTETISLRLPSVEEKAWAEEKMLDNEYLTVHDREILQSFLSAPDYTNTLKVCAFAVGYCNSEIEPQKLGLQIIDCVINKADSHYLLYAGRRFLADEQYREIIYKKIAIRLLGAGADKGSTDAMFALAFFYIREKNFKMAEEYMKRTVKTYLENNHGMRIGGYAFLDNLSVAADQVAKGLGAKEPHEKSLYCSILINRYAVYVEDESLILGICYFEQIYPTEEGKKKAKHHLTSAANGREYSDVANYYLGMLYAKQKTVEDKKKACEYFSKAIAEAKILEESRKSRHFPPEFSNTGDYAAGELERCLREIKEMEMASERCLREMKETALEKKAVESATPHDSRPGETSAWGYIAETIGRCVIL